MSIKEYADSIGVPLEKLDGIINLHGLFSVEWYKLCSRVLGIPMDEMLAEINDSTDAVSQSAKRESDRRTFQTANMLFNEIIMQEKIVAR